MNNLDANVVLRFVLDDLPSQSIKAKRSIITTQCYLSDVIMTEVVFVLEKVRGFRRADIAVLMNKLIRLQTVVCNEGLLADAISLYARKNQLSFPDCYAAIEAKLSGDMLLSFDKDLQKHGGDHVREP